MVGPGNHFFDLTAEEDRVITPNNDKKVVARTKEEVRSAHPRVVLRCVGPSSVGRWGWHPIHQCARNHIVGKRQ